MYIHKDIFSTINGHKPTYIIQQCNCLSLRPFGLARSLTKYQPCVYAERKGRGNCADAKYRDTPGTISISMENKDNPQVVNMFSQFAPGKPGVYYKTITGGETSDERLTWFWKCLIKFKKHLKHRDASETIFVPYKIGCGLAGGSWTKYKKYLNVWAGKIRQKVYLCYLP